MNLSIKNGCIYLSKKAMMPGLYFLYCTYSQYQSNDEKYLVNDEYQKYQTLSSVIDVELHSIIEKHL